MADDHEKIANSVLTAPSVSRREFLRQTAGIVGMGGVIGCAGGEESGSLRLSTFSADVTPPIGHPLIGGSWLPRTKKIVDPLFARGLVLLDAVAQPVVLVALDWCELRNRAFDRWRDELADAAGTSRQRVLLHCVHQHDAPYVDLEAQRLLAQQDVSWRMFERPFFDRSIARVKKAIVESLEDPRPVTHIGVGKARVERIASNRRVVLPDGTVRYSRGSTTVDETIRTAPPGRVDPWLRMVSFWNASQPLAAISSYATHPMSYYGRGGVSADFVGMARARHQEEHPDVFQIYVTGCSGDITGGKYNDPSQPEVSRRQFATRLQEAMAEAWASTERTTVESPKFRCEPLYLEPRTTGPFAPSAMRERIQNSALPKGTRVQAALGLSWHERVASGQPIDVPVVDLGSVVIMLLPAETFVGYQLLAQDQRPDTMVITAGYGECAPGYLPTADTWESFVSAHGSYCWTRPSSADRMRATIHQVLRSG